MSGGGKSKTTVTTPPASPQELAALEAQTATLRQMQEALQGQFAEGQLLSPALFEQAGLRPIYSQAGSADDPNDPRPTPDLAFQHVQQAHMQKYGIPIPPRGMPMAQQQANQLLATWTTSWEQRQQQRTQSAQAQAGRITGFEADPNFRLAPLTPPAPPAPTPAEQTQATLRSEIETDLLRRSQAALRGDLPVDPALIRSIQEGEATLREQLRAQLGPGFETSTPGIEALANFQKRKLEVLDAARRGDLTMAESLGINREAMGLERSRLGLEGESVRGNLTLAQAQAQQERANMTLGRILAASQRNAPYISGLGNVAAGYQNPINALLAARQGNKTQTTSSGGGGLGSIVGSVAGATLGSFAGGAGGAAGAVWGEQLFR